MTPENLDSVQLTDHAREKLGELGVRDSWVIGRVNNGHGFFFRDSNQGNWHYDCYFPDRDLAAAIRVEWDTQRNEKVAVVLSVFSVRNHIARYHSGSRFEAVETAANREQAP